MMYSSVTEIFDAIEGTRHCIYERVGSLDHEQQSFRPSTEAWSVREIVEHLAIMEERLSKLMGMMLAKAEAASKEEGAGADERRAMEPFTLDHFIERSAQEKYQAPETVSPSGSLDLTDLLERLRQSRAQLRGLAPRIEATDLSGALYPHPVFGPLNFYQWLAFIGVHEERHLGQIESLLTSRQ
jgi:uncharacterized damage-inducible protein DinB